MGRLEKQIIIGALALVGVLLTVVVLKGLKPRDGASSSAVNGWDDGELVQPELSERPDLVVDPGRVIPLDDEPANPNKIDSNRGNGQLPVVDNTPPPVQPSIEPEQDSDDSTWIYTVKPGEVLGKICQRELGSVNYMDEVLALNPGLNPDKVDRDLKITMPSLKSLRREERQSRPKNDLPAGVKSHVVVPNDSLWNLSEKYYGTSSKMGAIVAANRHLLDNEETVLTIGWVLVIPE